MFVISFFVMKLINYFYFTVIVLNIYANVYISNALFLVEKWKCVNSIKVFLDGLH